MVFCTVKRAYSVRHRKYPSIVKPQLEYLHSNISSMSSKQMKRNKRISGRTVVESQTASLKRDLGLRDLELSLKRTILIGDSSLQISGKFLQSCLLCIEQDLMGLNFIGEI